MKTTINFIHRFNELVEKLKANSEVALVNYYLFPPATEAQIAAAEKKLGFNIDEEIKAFYRECNGAQLLWIYKNSPDYHPRLYGTTTNEPWRAEDVKKESGAMSGIVNIQDIESVFSSDIETQYGKYPFFDSPDEENIILDGHETNYFNFIKDIKIFDLFDFFYCFGLLARPNTPSFPILFGSSEMTFYLYSHSLSFSQYLEIIFTCQANMNFILDNFHPSEYLTSSKPISDERFKEIISTA